MKRGRKKTRITANNKDIILAEYYDKHKKAADTVVNKFLDKYGNKGIPRGWISNKDIFVQQISDRTHLVYNSKKTFNAAIRSAINEMTGLGKDLNIVKYEGINRNKFFKNARSLNNKFEEYKDVSGNPSFRSPTGIQATETNILGYYLLKNSSVIALKLRVKTQDSSYFEAYEYVDTKDLNNNTLAALGVPR